MKISFAFLILLLSGGNCLSQAINRMYVLGQGRWEEGEMLFVVVFEENNHYQNYQWNITTQNIMTQDSGKYYIVNDTITLQPSHSAQHPIEYVISKFEGNNILRLLGKVYNSDGSVSDIGLGARPIVELGKELYKQWLHDSCKN